MKNYGDIEVCGERLPDSVLASRLFMLKNVKGAGLYHLTPGKKPELIQPYIQAYSGFWTPEIQSNERTPKIRAFQYCKGRYNVLGTQVFISFTIHAYVDNIFDYGEGNIIVSGFPIPLVFGSDIRPFIPTGEIALGVDTMKDNMRWEVINQNSFTLRGTNYDPQFLNLKKSQNSKEIVTGDIILNGCGTVEISETL